MSGRSRTGSRITQNNVHASTPVRRAILSSAIAKPLPAHVVELAGRDEAEIRFAEAAESDDDGELENGRSGPLNDSELLAAVASGGR